MSEKQKLSQILSRFGDDVSVESVIYCFIQEMGKDFSALRLNRWISELNNILYDKQLEFEKVARVSLERATYLKKYLEGKLYTNEETAKLHLGVQIENVQKIIDAVNKI